MDSFSSLDMFVIVTLNCFSVYFHHMGPLSGNFYCLLFFLMYGHTVLFRFTSFNYLLKIEDFRFWNNSGTQCSLPRWLLLFISFARLFSYFLSDLARLIICSLCPLSCEASNLLALILSSLLFLF